MTYWLAQRFHAKMGQTQTQFGVKVNHAFCLTETIIEFDVG